MEINICHLYPDTLNLYGDRGNLVCMERRLEWRGFDVSVRELPVGENADLTEYDIIFIGGGVGAEQEALLRDLAGQKAESIRAAVEAGVVVLAVCEGFELMGKSIKRPDGTVTMGAGAVDFLTEYSAERLTGNFAFTCPDTGETVVAFENHAGRVTLRERTAPLGTVVSGHGNNGVDGTEGARYKNFFGSYGHGPLLPKNPGLCDFILQAAVSRRYPGYALQPLDDGLEDAARALMEKRLAI